MLTRMTFTPYMQPVTKAARPTDTRTWTEDRKARSRLQQNPVRKTTPAHSSSFRMSFRFSTEAISRQTMEKIGSTTQLKIAEELSNENIAAT